MKKRIFASVISAFMILSALCLTAQAFPFNEYNSEKQNLDISIGYDYDTDNDDVLVDQGLAFARTLTYTGYKDHRSEYVQNARLTVKLPEDYFFPENSHLSDPDKYNYTASEGDSFYEWYEEEGNQKFSDNRVSWSISHEIFEFRLYSPGSDETIEEAMRKKADEYKDRVFTTIYSTDYIWNTAENPVSVEEDGNGGYKIVTDGFFDDTKYFSIEEDWGGFKESYLEGRYFTRITTIPELPGVFIVVSFGQSRAFNATIEGPAHTDYKAVYDKGKERIGAYWSKNIGEQFLNIESLMTVIWDEPTITPSGGEESEESKTIIGGVTQDAEENPGEDGGVSVPAAVVVSVLGGGAAIAGAAAASGSSDSKKKKQSGHYSSI